MLKNDFLKELTILYVEDEEAARNQLARTLNRLFKTVILASNGLEGFLRYEESLKNNMKIDLILSDVNMPKLNGIEMLEKIRQKDKNIPIIYTTARSETEYLLKAIDLNADHYALKPVNLEDLILRIHKVCEKKYFQNLIEIKNKELQQYLSIVNNVAAILRMNDKGEIIFLNSHFLDSFKCEKKELLNKQFEDIIHKENSKELIDNMWKEVQNDKIWDNNIKYLNKKNEIFYINSTIFKIYVEDKIEYINIGFLSTKNVNEKREFHKNIIKNLNKNNLENNKQNEEIKNLEERNTNLELLVNKLKQNVSSEHQKKLDEKSQIQFYESELLGVDERLNKKLILKNKEIEAYQDEIKKLDFDKKLFSMDLHKLEKKLEDTNYEINKLKIKIEEDKKRIFDLNDLLTHRESQLKKLDPSLV